jgi:hypothetical protein
LDFRTYHIRHTTIAARRKANAETSAHHFDHRTRTLPASCDCKRLPSPQISTTMKLYVALWLSTVSAFAPASVRVNRVRFRYHCRSIPMSATGGVRDVGTLPYLMGNFFMSRPQTILDIT